MRALRVVVGVAATAMTVFGSVGVAPSAQASNYGIELNGTWRVMSNGEWARTNQVLIDEKTTIENWTISSSCVSPIECTGTVTSDAGWTAPINLVKVTGSSTGTSPVGHRARTARSHPGIRSSLSGVSTRR